MHSQGTLEVMMLARHEGSFNGTGCPADREPPRGVSRLEENAAADDVDLTGGPARAPRSSPGAGGRPLRRHEPGQPLSDAKAMVLST